MFKTKLSASRCAYFHKTQGSYQCSVEDCGKIFAHKHSYSSHVKRAHFPNENKYPCHLCEKSFKTRPSLNRHIMMVHTLKERSVPCPQCPKKFKTQKLLKRHLLCHENKSFACPYEGCSVVRNLQYSISHHFKIAHGKVNHMLTLEERLSRRNAMEIKTPCKICKLPIKAGKCKEYNMKLHLKRHEDNVPVSCPIGDCQDKIYQVENKNGYSFMLYGKFFEHLKKIHNISMITHTLS